MISSLQKVCDKLNLTQKRHGICPLLCFLSKNHPSNPCAPCKCKKIAFSTLAEDFLEDKIIVNQNWSFEHIFSGL